jgi:predicted Zn-dependent protease
MTRKVFFLLPLAFMVCVPRVQATGAAQGSPWATREGVGRGGTIRVAGLLDDLLKSQGLGQSQDKKQSGATGKEKDKNAQDEEKRKQLFEGVSAILSSGAGIDYASEVTIGESLALEGFRRYGLPVEDEAFQKYVNLVGNAVARNSLRPGIPYRFVVVDSPLKNAFSCPGGIIFVCSGLLGILENEEQLANILAHEVAHVSHKHALQSIRRARFFQGVGKITAATMEGDKGKQFESMIGDLQTTLFDKGLDQNMEFEADLSGMDTAYRTGYSPGAMIDVLETLKRTEAGSTKAGSWFSTHPPLGQRIERCTAHLKTFSDWKGTEKNAYRFNKYKGRLSSGAK